MSNDKKDLKEIIEKNYNMNIEFIDKKDKFTFGCNSCGKCCTNSIVDSIILKPYDLFNLGKSLNLSLEEVVSKYTECYVGDNSGFVITKLKPVKMLFTNNIICPFLENNKCKVHNLKPNACRLYPLGRGSIPNYDDNTSEVIYFLNKDVKCGNKKESHTVEDWICDNDTYENLIKLETDFLIKLNDSMKLTTLKDYYSADEYAHSTINKIKEVLYSFILKYYYLNYDLNEDFTTQYTNNIKRILEFAETFSPIVKKYMEAA